MGKIFILCDFVVMGMKEDAHIPFIFGRPFLTTTGAMIYVKNGRLSLQVRDENLEFRVCSFRG